jgi:hypothetical protein
MQVEPSTLQVQHNPAQKRFEVTANGHLSIVEYILTANRIIFTHTEVPPALEGNGIAARLAHAGLEYAKSENLQVMPLCPYVAAYMRSHSEYQVLLVPGFRV